MRSIITYPRDGKGGKAKEAKCSINRESYAIHLCALVNRVTIAGREYRIDKAAEGSEAQHNHCIALGEDVGSGDGELHNGFSKVIGDEDHFPRGGGCHMAFVLRKRVVLDELGLYKIKSPKGIHLVFVVLKVHVVLLVIRRKHLVLGTVAICLLRYRRFLRQGISLEFRIHVSLLRRRIGCIQKTPHSALGHAGKLFTRQAEKIDVSSGQVGT